MSSTETERHLTDAELVRYLDEGADAAESHRWRRHVEGCRRCDDALRTVRSESRLVSEWLERAAFEAPSAAPRAAAGAGTGAAGAADMDEAGSESEWQPGAGRVLAPRRMPRPAVTPWLRAAAVILLVAAPLAALPGVRSWVAERVAGPGTAPTAGPEPTAATAGQPTVLRFVPAAGMFAVRFDPGSRGVLTLERSGDPEAELRTRGGEPEATVSPSLLRIRNAEPARYRLLLPPATTSVSVSIGERVTVLTGDQIDGGRRVELEELIR